MANKKKKRPVAPPAPVRTAPPRVKAEPGLSTRAVEREAAANAVARERRVRRLVAGGLATAAVVGVGAFVLADRRQNAELQTALTTGTCTTDEQTDPTAGAGSNHVPSPTFAVNPPAGGNHLIGAARGGVYAGARVPSDGLLVHSLEHGYVVVWHQPGLPAAQLAQLTDFQSARSGDVLVVERASLPVPVAATAWGQRLLCRQAEGSTLERFFNAYVGKGPEDVPRG